ASLPPPHTASSCGTVCPSWPSWTGPPANPSAPTNAPGPVSPRWTRTWRPQTNGKVERFHRTLLEEWAYIQPYTSDSERQAAFPGWLDWYNYHRPHTGIGGHTPASRVTNLS
ncbi:integrase core domain-containing protein, partial [Streptomyces bungoensis]|uniref:integrase core domain-containing protein n=1 Tax=Streptomyces bungoensis TaxID=285568 RepID=UPI0033F79DE6